MSLSLRKWGTLVILSLIWGSSYILIKKGLTGLTPIQLGSLRVIVTTIIIAPIGYQKIKHIPKQKMKWVALSAFVGSFFPAYLFAFAETQISSSITAVMVSLTPLFTLLISIYELPHIKDRMTNVPHFLKLKLTYLFFGSINFTCLILFLSTISITNLYES